MPLESYQRAFALDDGLHLNSAGVSPMSEPARDALSQAASLQAREGTLGVMRLLDQTRAARARVAELVGAKSENVSFMSSCAAAISQVALGFPLAPGDEIVTLDQEYPSNAYPWHVAAERSGARVVVVKSRPDFAIDHDALLAAIGARTRIVAVSFVQFSTGAVADLARLSAACRKVDAWLAVDAIQGIGVVPFDLDAMGVDAVACGTHKWLCGPLGHGFLALADGRRDRLTPVSIGAMTYGTPDDAVDPARPMRTDAHRFEPGAPAVFATAATDAAVALTLACGVAALGKAACEAADLLVEGARSRGHTVLSSTMGGEARSPIVTFTLARGDARAVHKRLVEQRVACAHRAGGIRVSPHAFTTSGDVARFFEILDATTAELARA